MTSEAFAAAVWHAPVVLDFGGLELHLDGDGVDLLLLGLLVDHQGAEHAPGGVH